jgi:hypothetical protein
MTDSFDKLAANASFRKLASAMRSAVPTGKLQPIDGIFEHIQRFMSIRRHEVRVMLLTEAGRADEDKWQSYRDRIPDAINSMNTAVKLLSANAQALKPLISSQLDDVLALAAKETHPLHTMLRERFIALGLSQKEADWLHGELQSIKYQIVQYVCADGIDDLLALLAGISVGEAGLSVAGFVRFTGDPKTDERIESVVIRLREQSITANILLVLIIVWIAHTVARQSQSAR